MKNLTLLLLAFVICLASAQTPDPRVCTDQEKLPGYCTFIYKPVCGVYINDDGKQIKQTFGNRCSACKAKKVQYVYQGVCDSYPKKSQFCIPVPPELVLCSTDYDPVCGYFNKNVQCLVAPCANTGTNACLACIDKNVDYYIKGVCPKK